MTGVTGLTWDVDRRGWKGGYNVVMQNRHIVQRPSVHEGVGVDRVDGPSRVPWLPPAIHGLWLQLPHLLPITPCESLAD